MGTKRKSAHQKELQERQLDFDSVLLSMGDRILRKSGAYALEIGSESGIDLCKAQRRLPRALGKDGLGRPSREMPRPQQQNAPRQFDVRHAIDASGYMSRETISPA